MILYVLPMIRNRVNSRDLIQTGHKTGHVELGFLHGHICDIYECINSCIANLVLWYTVYIILMKFILEDSNMKFIIIIFIFVVRAFYIRGNPYEIHNPAIYFAFLYLKFKQLKSVFCLKLRHTVYTVIHYN